MGGNYEKSMYNQLMEVMAKQLSKDQNKPSKAPNTYNGRKPTQKKPGAQPGHKGHSLSLPVSSHMTMKRPYTTSGLAMVSVTFTWNDIF